MGQKVHPRAFRLGIISGWDSQWFNKKQYQDFLKQDIILRDFLLKKLAKASVENIKIERQGDQLSIIIFTSRPGLIIGRQGMGIEDLRKKLLGLTAGQHSKDKKINLRVDIQEVKNPQSSASIVAQSITEQIEKRLRFRRVLKQSLEKIKQQKEVQGAKIMIKGRLDGNEIARREHLSFGHLPLQTLRASIDYGQSTAYTTYGTVGVKVWIYKGEIFD